MYSEHFIFPPIHTIFFKEKEKASMQGDGTPLSTNPKGARQTSRRGGRKRKTSQLYNKQFTKKGKVSAKIDAVVQQDKTKNMNNIQPNAIENSDLNIEVTENIEHVSTNADADDISTNVEMIDNNELEINEESSDTTRHVELFEDIIIDECNASEKVAKTTKNIR